MVVCDGAKRTELQLLTMFFVLRIFIILYDYSIVNIVGISDKFDREPTWRHHWNDAW
jgi:hypothetical protein